MNEKNITFKKNCNNFHILSEFSPYFLLWKHFEIAQKRRPC